MKNIQLQLFSLAFILLVFSPFARKAQAQQLTLGAKTGLNYSTVALDNFDTYDYRSGSNIGGFAEFQTDALPVKITAELHYNRFGANNIEPVLVYFPESPLLNLETGIVESDFYFNTMDVPLMVKYPLPFMEAFSPHIYLGGVYTYIGSAYNVNQFEDEQIAENEITERIAASDYSGLIGVGGAIDMAPFAITYDLRYRMGFANMSNIQDYPEFTAHSFQVMVGFGYQLDLNTLFSGGGSSQEDGSSEE